MMLLKNKVAFVTGGGSGIGLRMATAFLKHGMKVVVGDIRTDRLPRVQAFLQKISPHIGLWTLMFGASLKE